MDTNANQLSEHQGAAVDVGSGPLLAPFPATRGRIAQAKRFALMNFDKWNDVTGFVGPHTSYYYEIASLIEDGVEFGFGVAHGQTWKTIVKRIRDVPPLG